MRASVRAARTWWNIAPTVPRMVVRERPEIGIAPAFGGERLAGREAVYILAQPRQRAVDPLHVPLPRFGGLAFGLDAHGRIRVAGPDNPFDRASPPCDRRRRHEQREHRERGEERNDPPVRRRKPGEPRRDTGLRRRSTPQAIGAIGDVAEVDFPVAERDRAAQHLVQRRRRFTVCTRDVVQDPARRAVLDPLDAARRIAVEHRVQRIPEPDRVAGDLVRRGDHPDPAPEHPIGIRRDARDEHELAGRGLDAGGRSLRRDQRIDEIARRGEDTGGGRAQPAQRIGERIAVRFRVHEPCERGVERLPCFP